MGFSRFAVGREPDAVLLGRITAGLWSYRRPNRKEGFYMDKIRIITDTSSDISVEDAERWDIELLPVSYTHLLSSCQQQDALLLARLV